MSLVDIFLLLILGGFTYVGLYFGFVHTLGNLIGTLLGIVISARLTEPMFNWVGFLLGGGGFARVTIFILLFILIAHIFGMLFWFVDKVYKFIRIIPFVKTFNKLLGALLGFIEGFVVLSVGVFYANEFIQTQAFQDFVDQSILAHVFISVTSIFKFIFPMIS